MFDRRMLGVVIAAIGAAGLLGCGDDEAADSTGSAVSSSTKLSGGRIYSRAAQLGAGSREELLSTPEARVAAACKASGDGTVVVDGRGSTSYAVVTSHEGDTLQPKLQPGEEWVGVPIDSPDTQTWTISPFAAGDVQPTMITVSFSDSEPPKNLYDCAVFAMAVVGRPGVTLTK